MADELSKWGQDYGAALCLAPDREALPFDQLTPAEQQCVRTVGLHAETKLDEHFGLPTPPDVARYRLRGAHGEDLGRLTYADGTLNLCVPKAQQPQCQVLGYGHDGLNAALRTLQLLGWQAERE